MSNETTEKKKLSTKEIVMIGMFGAISSVLMLLEISFPLIPSFIKFDFSELPVILGGYMMGPVAGALIAFIKVALHFVLKGTSTMGVGELSNFMGSIFYMLPSVLIYHKLRSKKGAAISLVIGTIFCSCCLLITNSFFIFPMYAKVFGMPMDAFVSMGSAVNPLVTSYFTLMLFSVFPFNLVKYGIISFLSFHMYKRLKHTLKL